MIFLIEQNNPLFDDECARAFFEKHRVDLDDTNGFDAILRAGRFFNVHHNGYIGSVFVYQGIDDRYYIGGYAVRKHHHDVVEAIRYVSGLYDEVYAHTRHLNAVLALKKAGFDWFDRKHNLLRKIKT